MEEFERSCVSNAYYIYRKTATHLPYKAGKVKLETTVLQFPNTRRGESSTMKIKVYNGEGSENKVRGCYSVKWMMLYCCLTV